MMVFYYFDLFTKIKAHVAVLYHGGQFLEKWKEVQRKVSRLIYGFSVRESKVNEWLSWLSH
ncbi:hypothetical protein ACLD02_10100 [Alloalcanivorax sp. C16-2]|uniref:hypothetical protein n=1 Tax=Alloalcanivorax TaxID=3020832 RepID=UPI0019315D2B|nr:hypothetical protein [Alloalcanivorax marinus]MBL7249725.1 hypothetical protein [Alloalcanivorax marinus]